jgi:hypothetical protein
MDTTVRPEFEAAYQRALRRIGNRPDPWLVAAHSNAVILADISPLVGLAEMQRLTAVFDNYATEADG